MGQDDVERRRRADESVSRVFSLAMNASTSRWGVLCDVVFASVVAGLGGFVWVLARHLHRPALMVFGIALTVAPLLTCVGANIALSRARSRVVDWLTSLPFPIENLNAILVGLGEEFEIHFAGEMPSRDEVMAHLSRVSEDVFVLEVDDDRKVMLARLGVEVHKHLATIAGWMRYDRFRRVVEMSLVPLHEEHAIGLVRLT